MREPLERAVDLVSPVQAEAASLRLLGGGACVAHLGALARRSDDLDVVAMSEPAREAIVEHLRDVGFAIGQSGGWWRGVRGKGREREIVAHRIEADDLGRLAASSALQARYDLSKGQLDEVFCQLVGREPSRGENDAFQKFLVELEEAGL